MFAGYYKLICWFLHSQLCPFGCCCCGFFFPFFRFHTHRWVVELCVHSYTHSHGTRMQCTRVLLVLNETPNNCVVLCILTSRSHVAKLSLHQPNAFNFFRKQMEPNINVPTHYSTRCICVRLWVSFLYLTLWSTQYLILYSIAFSFALTLSPSCLFARAFALPLS